MADDQPTEAFSLLAFDRPQFDAVMRGYDRRQVDEHIERLDAEFVAAATDRDAALARSADLAAQLANSYAETESLRRKVRSESATVITAGNVSDRIRTMLELAEEESVRLREEAAHYAEQIRRTTDEDVARIRSESRAEAERLTGLAQIRVSDVEAAYQARINEGDAYLAEQRALAVSEARATRAQLEAEIAQATAERDALNAEHHAERERLDAEHAAERERLDTEHAMERERLNSEHAAAREELDAAGETHRRTATEDFEIALRSRRRSEEQADAARRAESLERAATIVSDAQAQSAAMIAAAQEEVRRLREQRDSTTEHLTRMHAAIDAILAASRTESQASLQA
jgi:cell division septum initiation protein DivIVA